MVESQATKKHPRGCFVGSLGAGADQLDPTARSTIDTRTRPALARWWIGNIRSGIRVMTVSGWVEEGAHSVCAMGRRQRSWGRAPRFQGPAAAG
jgi:hypothetical protein